MRLGCAYLEDLDEYRFYPPEGSGELISLLAGADEVVSFNGNRFDLLILPLPLRSCGNGSMPSGGVRGQTDPEGQKRRPGPRGPRERPTSYGPGLRRTGPE